MRAIGGYNKTPAVAALAGRHFELAQILCRKGSSVNILGHDGNSPLHSAVNHTDFELVQALVDCGADVNRRNEYGFILFLLSQIGEIGKTSLHLALILGRIDIARILVEHGASVKVKDESGKSPLDYALEEQRREIIKLYRAKREICCIM